MINRTEILIVSIITRNGFSQSGAPAGKSPAVNDLGAWRAPLKIIPSQIGKPNDKVRIRWPENLNTYGNKPIKLRKINKIKRAEIINGSPFKWVMKVRDNWL